MRRDTIKFGLLLVGALLLVLAFAPTTGDAAPPAQTEPSATPTVVSPEAPPLLTPTVLSPEAPPTPTPTVVSPEAPPTTTPVTSTPTDRLPTTVTDAPSDTPLPTVIVPTTTAPPSGRPDPALITAVYPQLARVDDQVRFIVYVMNNSALPAEDVVVVDTLPGFAEILQISATRGILDVQGNTVTVRLGTVAPGEVLTVRMMTQIKGDVQANNPNIATLSSAGDDDPHNNTASVALQVVATGETATPPNVVPDVPAAPVQPSPLASEPFSPESGPGFVPTPALLSVSPPPVPVPDAYPPPLPTLPSPPAPSTQEPAAPPTTTPIGVYPGDIAPFDGGTSPEQAGYPNPAAAPTLPLAPPSGDPEAQPSAPAVDNGLPLLPDTAARSGHVSIPLAVLGGLLFVSGVLIRRRPNVG